MLKKGLILVFKTREEIIKSASNDRVKGDVVTNIQTYSTDFIYRWIELGFIKIKQQ